MVVTVTSAELEPVHVVLASMFRLFFSQNARLNNKPRLCTQCTSATEHSFDHYGWQPKTLPSSRFCSSDANWKQHFPCRYSEGKKCLKPDSLEIRVECWEWFYWSFPTVNTDLTSYICPKFCNSLILPIDAHFHHLQIWRVWGIVQLFEILVCLDKLHRLAGKPALIPL